MEARFSDSKLIYLGVSKSETYSPSKDSLKRYAAAGRLKAYACPALPMSITVLDLSAYVGLVAVGVVTLNLLLGMRYSPHRSWPHRRFNYFRLHNWLGYIALSASLLHPSILLLNREPRFRLFDLV
jgi:predicted ferric reductase